MMYFFKKPKVEQVLELPIANIRPNSAQPRTVFDEDELKNLAQSIEQNGLLQPVAVRKTESGYELISGERRLRACKLLGYKNIRAILVDASEQRSAVLALIENLQREDLNFFDEARALYELTCRLELTQEEAAQKLGMAQSTLANKLRLLRLPTEVQEAVQEYGLTERHARALLRLETPKQQTEVISAVLRRHLNVAQTERFIDELSQQHTKPSKRILVVKDLRIFINTIDRAIDTMKQAGIEAVSCQNDKTDYIEYVVKIPKHSAYSNHQ
ncbi:MAG: ParB/RepB/Spo0J family partition protein [Hydrogenoanaerobacterium sp.]